jgi:uncharacterized protein YbjT (DUF2867 family)
MLIAAAVVLAACGTSPIEYVSESASYDSPGLERLLDESDSGHVAERPSADAEELRSEALASLRRQGAGGKTAADIITATFPGVARAVPFYVESATYENLNVTIIIEATGREQGSLNERRLWVLDGDGEVLISLMR